MSEKDEYTEKFVAELDVVQARLDELKNQRKKLAADEQIRHARQVEDLQRMADATKAKLKEMAEADDDAWNLLKDGVENIWGDLQSTLENTVTTFKE
ncbi:hypothetical protein JWG42_10345 [Desulfoprunum benzoelyticum]|uniref:Coiled coil domain-containing protein n=1 Tax=Desulfoprunum benzoelyticum TaxID=1506996 RepID=A0A840V2K0_9BACT|nr:hypothetical protein [Desulfoprunum benzoelyticum]MBB5349058.1 hypothetical protein [Desulfoprunum benzoelyticum]MBM9530548.1 hypothetical protein [Desulfoprunum benzoelyticum]